ncbi:hypothetical protein AB0P36_00160 [Streptomyces flavidovirens]
MATGPRLAATGPAQAAAHEGGLHLGKVQYNGPGSDMARLINPSGT